MSLLERDRDGDGGADDKRVLLEGLGPARRGTARRMAVPRRTQRSGRALRRGTGTITGTYPAHPDGLPVDGFHRTKTIAFGPDGWLYLSQGSTCNVCVEQDHAPRDHHAHASRRQRSRDPCDRPAQQRGLRLGAVGRGPVRNRERARPARRRLSARRTEPDRGRIVLRMAVFPRRRRRRTRSSARYSGAAGADLTRPWLQPHNAPLGIHFLRGNAPAGYDRTALVALHGSWNRSRPTATRSWRSAGSRTAASSSRIS